MEELQKSYHKVFKIKYHFVFSIKYRKDLFLEEKYVNAMKEVSLLNLPIFYVQISITMIYMPRYPSHVNTLFKELYKS